jgi:hypothetical protein
MHIAGFIFTIFLVRSRECFVEDLLRTKINIRIPVKSRDFFLENGNQDFYTGVRRKFSSNGRTAILRKECRGNSLRYLSRGN